MTIFSPDGRLLASIPGGTSLQLFDATSRKPVGVAQEGHRGNVTTVSYSPNSDHVLSCSWDKTMRVWSTQTGELVRVMSGHTGAVLSASWAPGDHANVVASSSWDKTARLWHAVDHKGGGVGSEARARAVLSGHRGVVWDVQWAPSGGRWLATSSADKTVRVWDAGATTHEAVHVWTSHKLAVRAVSWKDDSVLASGSWDKTIHVHDARSGADNVGLGWRHDRGINCVAWQRRMESPLLASGSKDGQARIWDLRVPSRAVHVIKHAGNINSVAWATNGTSQLVTASADGTAKLFDANTGKVLGVFDASGSVMDGGDVLLAELGRGKSDGKLATLSSRGMAVRIFDTSTCEQCGACFLLGVAKLHVPAPGGVPRASAAPPLLPPSAPVSAAGGKDDIGGMSATSKSHQMSNKKEISELLTLAPNGDPGPTFENGPVYTGLSPKATLREVQALVQQGSSILGMMGETRSSPGTSKDRQRRAKKKSVVGKDDDGHEIERTGQACVTCHVSIATFQAMQRRAEMAEKKLAEAQRQLGELLKHRSAVQALATTFMSVERDQQQAEKAHQRGQTTTTT